MDARRTSLVPPEQFATFGDLLKYLRRQAGLTQRELSLEVGYSEPQISYLEKNHRLPDVTTVTARFLLALDLEHDSPLAQRLIQLAEVSRIESQSSMRAPYMGLQFFDVQDADLFFGRELLTARLVKHLRKHQFLAIVVGASGSGKSSIVRAGLIPALQRGGRLADDSLPPPGSAHWKYYVVTPGVQPLASLIEALHDSTVNAGAISKSFKDFVADKSSLDKKAPEILKLSKRSPVTNREHILLIVDQFEELFTLCDDEVERRAFIDNLMFSASSQSTGLMSIVITLRADFYAHCAQYTNLRDGLARHQEYIGPMSRQELQKAIELPALNAGLGFEPGLIDMILKDIGDEPGALPLLSHALLETWKRRQNRLLTFRAYNQSGGIRGAIARTAEDVFLHLDAGQQVFARRIFLALTEPGQMSERGLLTPDSRRRVQLGQLISQKNEAKAVEGLLKTLSDARLIIVTEDSVEVAHEALIREWPRLRDWLSEDRGNLILHRQLSQAADRWETDGQKPDDLYRGSRLSQALEWADGHIDELGVLERTFLNASNSQNEKELAERETQRRKELLAAKRLAEAESQRAEEHKRASQRLRQRAWILAVMFALAGILAVSAMGLSRQRNEAVKLAISRELASASISNLDIDPERSILLALEALSVSRTREAEEALHQAVFTSRVEMTLTGHEGVVGVAVYSPDGMDIATAGEDGDVRLWDSKTGENVLIFSGHGGPIYEVIFSPSGKRIATAGEDGTARIWDIDTGETILILDHQVPIVGLSFSPDEKLLATGGVDGSTHLWELESGKEVRINQEHQDVVISIAFTPDGKQLITSSYDARLIFWDIEGGEKLREWEGEFGEMIFSEDGSRITAGFPEGGRILDSVSGDELIRTGGHTNLVYTTTINRDWTRFATGGLDRKVVISDAGNGRVLFTLTGHTGTILDAHFSPDGDRLVTASTDGTARVWNVGPASEVLAMDVVDGHGRLAFSPDGSMIAASSMNSVKVWDALNGYEHQSFEVPDLATGVAFDPDGSRLAGAAESGEVWIWNLTTGKTILTINASDEIIMFLAFSPDGKWLATASPDGAKVWDAATGELIMGFPGVEVLSVCFSPDNRQLLGTRIDDRAVLWDLNSGRGILSVEHGDIIWGCAFSPNGGQFATASRDGTAKIWDSTNGEGLLQLTGHTSTVTSVYFSPDGNQLATTSRDGVTKLWDAKNGELLLNLYGDGEGKNGVAISPTGDLLASAGGSSIHVYLMKLDDLISLAQSRLTRSLTTEECRQYLHAEQCP